MAPEGSANALPVRAADDANRVKRRGEAFMGSEVDASSWSAVPFEVPRPLGPEDRARFRRRLQAATEASGLDALLLLEMPSVVWATGFHHSPNERPVGAFVPVEGDPILFVPLLEREHAEEIPGMRVETYLEFPGEVPAAAWMVDRIAAMGHRRVGIDALDVSLWSGVTQRIQHAQITHVAHRVRAIKDDAEMALVRAAARYADACLDAILRGGAAVVAGGGTELDVLDLGVTAARNLQARELGDRFGPAKTTVVGTAHSGPRAALPHGRTSDRKPAWGEVMIAGIGGSVGGYHAESGATFSLGEPTADQRRCLEAAEACHDAAIDALVPGARCADVNEAGWDALRAAGLFEHVRHRVGHAMGVEGHEGPWLSPGDATLVQPGMVFSNEPGIYRPGIDGYRTIDSMIVLEDGVELPSTFQTRVPWHERILAPTS